MGNPTLNHAPISTGPNGSSKAPDVRLGTRNHVPYKIRPCHSKLNENPEQVVLKNDLVFLWKYSFLHTHTHTRINKKMASKCENKYS